MQQPFLALQSADARRGDPVGTTIALSLFVILGYVLTGFAGLRLAFIGEAVTLFWPPSGIAFAALWLGGFRLAPAIAIGAFVVNLVALGSPQPALLVAVGNMLPATVATILLRRLIGRREGTAAAAGEAPPGEVWRVLCFIFVAVLGSTMLSATIGTLAVAASSTAGDGITSTWMVWWMGDAMGVMIVAPPILLWRRVVAARWDLRGILDALAFAFAGFGIIAGLLLIDSPIWAVELCKLFTLFLSLGAGIRFGLNGPAAMTLLMALGGVSVTMLGLGPFARPDFYDSFALLHTFLFAEAIAGLLLAAALADLRRTAAAEQRARAAAEAASAERIRLLTMISHDVRNPLGGMMGVLQSLREAALPPPQARLVDLGLRAGSTLTTLVADILDVARADAGRITLQPVPFDPARSLADIVAINRDQALASGLDLAATGLATLPALVLGDRARFEQLFSNLVANAVAYTPGGRVRVGADWDEGTAIMAIEVADTGPGIDPDRVATMFDAFVLAPRPGPRSAGLGLGLHICRRLVDLMGGSIAYCPAPGGGSLFRVTLPLPAIADPVAAGADVPDPPQAILLVEDDAIAREVTTALLEGLGHRVSVAATAAAAVDLAAQARFDLVLMDLQLGPDEADGEVAGLAVARQIRAMAGQTRLFALTADANLATHRDCLDAGIDAVLVKPLSLGSGLAARLAEALAATEAAAVAVD